MRFRICLILLCCLPGFVHAFGNDHDKDKNDKNKDKVKCKKITVDPTIEEFVFILPSPEPSKSCIEHKAFRNSVVDFYKWYLQNEGKISEGMATGNNSKDLVPPFNISWQTLHEYFEFIQKNYASWINNIEATQFEGSQVSEMNTAKGINTKADSGSPTYNFSNTVN